VGGLFVAGDYNRKTGLVGNGSTKYLNSNRNNNADPQNSKHVSVFATSLTAATIPVAIGAGRGSGGATVIAINTTSVSLRNNAVAQAAISGAFSAGMFANSRSQSAFFVSRCQGLSSTSAITSEVPFDGNYAIYANIDGNGPANFSAARLAFYSIGESLDLALLDARVTDLINAIGAAF
jgi:hypothetical protein